MRYSEAKKHFPDSPLLHYEFYYSPETDIMPRKQYEYLLNVSDHILHNAIGDCTIDIYDKVEAIDIEDLYVMAKFKTDITFINIRLNASHKKAFKAYKDANLDDIDTLLVNLIAEDVKMSLSFDTTRDVFICSLTGKKDNRFNSGLCFTSRSNDLFEAMMLALFKHHVLAQEGQWKLAATEEDSWG